MHFPVLTLPGGNNLDQAMPENFKKLIQWILISFVTIPVQLLLIMTLHPP